MILAVGKGIKLVISISPPVEVVTGAGVTSAEDGVASDVPFTVSFVEVGSVVAVAGAVPFAVEEDPGSNVSMTLLNPSNRPPLLELELEVGGVVDVAVTTPVGNRRIPVEDEDGESAGVCDRIGVLVDSSRDEVGTGVEEESAGDWDRVGMLVESSEDGMGTDDVAFATGTAVDESESPRGRLRVGRIVGRVRKGDLVVDSSSSPVGVGVVFVSLSSLEADFVAETPFDWSSSLEAGFDVDGSSLPVGAELVFGSVPLLGTASVGAGETKTVVGTTIVVVPLSSSEDVSPRPRLARRSDMVSLLVDDDDVVRSGELLDCEGGLVMGMVVFVKTLFTCLGK